MSDLSLLTLTRDLTARWDLSEKAKSELEKALRKWFAAQVLKPMKLPALRAIHRGGAFNAFAEFLLGLDDADLIAVVAKLDPHRPEMQMRSSSEIVGHLGKLASAKIEPASQPKAQQRASKPKPRKASSERGILASSKY